MDNATLLKVLEECRADYARVKAEFGDSDAAANDLWGISNVEEIIGRLLRQADGQLGEKK